MAEETVVAESAEKDLEEILYDKTEEKSGQEEAVTETEQADKGEPKPEDEGKTTDTTEEATDEVVKYEDFVIPEGMKIDSEKIAGFTEIAGKYKIGQEDAQKLLDLAVNNVQEIMKAQEAALAETHTQWKEMVKNDPELGGSKLNETNELTHMALRKFGDESLTELYSQTGIGDCPAEIRAWAKVGRYMQEDNIVEGDGGIQKATEKTLGEILYDKSDMQ